MKLLLSLIVLGGSALAQRSVTLTWTNHPDNPPVGTGATATRFNVYRAATRCATAAPMFSKINAAGIAALSYKDDTVATGNVYCYVVRAFVNDPGSTTGGILESADSPRAEAVLSPKAPPSLTIVVEIAMTVNPQGEIVAKVTNLEQRK